MNIHFIIQLKIQNLYLILIIMMQILMPNHLIEQLIKLILNPIRIIHLHIIKTIRFI